MCKAIDNPSHHQARQHQGTATAAAATTTTEQPQQPLNNDVHNNNNHNSSGTTTTTTTTTTTNSRTKNKKRVRFHTVICSIDSFDKVTDPTEREMVWYNRKDYDAIKSEIGLVVQAKTSNDYLFQQQQQQHMYCFRGLEFLKLDDDIPSRKERRALFSKQVMVYQGVVVGNKEEEPDHHQLLLEAAEKKLRRDADREIIKSRAAINGLKVSDWEVDAILDKKEAEATSSSNITTTSSSTTTTTKEELIGSFCTTLSQGAKERAIELATQDETEARRVYQQCHLLYQGVNGEELCMFGDNNNRSSLCRSSSSSSRKGETTQQQTDGGGGGVMASFYKPFVQDALFSYDTIRRVIFSPLFSATTTTTATAV